MLEACWDLVEGIRGRRSREEIEADLEAYLALVREWNAFASLVSAGDLGARLEAHVLDSLSIAAHVVEACRDGGLWLDVGSGGGFPAIPVKAALPGTPVRLVERSAKKVGFLRQTVARLGLKGAAIVQGAFPQAGGEGEIAVVTSRAIEDPERVGKALAAWLPEGAVYLCQREQAPERLVGPMFHVEHVRDAWDARGLRRSALWRIRRTGPDGGDVPRRTER